MAALRDSLDYLLFLEASSDIETLSLINSIRRVCHRPICISIALIGLKHPINHAQFCSSLRYLLNRSGHHGITIQVFAAPDVDFLTDFAIAHYPLNNLPALYQDAPDNSVVVFYFTAVPPNVTIPTSKISHRVSPATLETVLTSLTHVNNNSIDTAIEQYSTFFCAIVTRLRPEVQPFLIAGHDRLIPLLRGKIWEYGLTVPFREIQYVMENFYRGLLKAISSLPDTAIANLTTPANHLLSMLENCKTNLELHSLLVQHAPRNPWEADDHATYRELIVFRVSLMRLFISRDLVNMQTNLRKHVPYLNRIFLTIEELDDHVRCLLEQVEREEFTHRELPRDQMSTIGRCRRLVVLVNFIFREIFDDADNYEEVEMSVEERLDRDDERDEIEELIGFVNTTFESSLGHDMIMNDTERFMNCCIARFFDE